MSEIFDLDLEELEAAARATLDATTGAIPGPYGLQGVGFGNRILGGPGHNIVADMRGRNHQANGVYLVAAANHAPELANAVLKLAAHVRALEEAYAAEMAWSATNREMAAEWLRLRKEYKQTLREGTSPEWWGKHGASFRLLEENIMDRLARPLPAAPGEE